MQASMINMQETQKIVKLLTDWSEVEYDCRSAGKKFFEDNLQNVLDLQKDEHLVAVLMYWASCAPLEVRLFKGKKVFKDIEDHLAGAITLQELFYGEEPKATGSEWANETKPVEVKLEDIWDKVGNGPDKPHGNMIQWVDSYDPMAEHQTDGNNTKD